MSASGLSADRARLLAELRRRGQGRSWAPLTATQQGIWLAEQLEPGLSGYHDTAVLSVSGPLDQQLLRQAFRHAQADHEALRGRVVDTDGMPRQCFDVDRMDWQLVDLRRVPAEQRQARLDRLVAAVAAQPFDLPAGPLWRARLVHLDDTEHALVVVIHHLIADGWSHGVLLRSLLDGYTAAVTGTVPPPRPSGYSAWLADRVRREREAVAAGAPAVVAARLREVPYRLRVPGLDPRPSERAAGELPVDLPAATLAAFDMACRRSGTTRFMALTGLFALALCRAGGRGREGVLLSAPLAGRYDGAADGLLGCLISIVPIEVSMGSDTPVPAAAAAGTAAVLEALSHAEVPYREIVRLSGPAAGDDPLTNVGIEEFNAPTGAVRLGSLRIQPLPRAQVRLRHDLTLSVPSVPGAPLTLLYPVARWSARSVADLAGELAELVTAATAARTA